MDACFNGLRLKSARLIRGLTVAELAAKTDVQRQTLSMYELGKSQPANADIVDDLAKALSFPVSFFYEGNLSGIAGTVYFRSLLTTSKKYRVEQEIKTQLLGRIYTFLQDYIQFPTFLPLYLECDDTPEAAASKLRESWQLGLGPIDNLVSIVEQHGILVTRFETRTNDIDAFSQMVQSNDGYTFLIAYSDNKNSASRIHFDIAHELGHILLHDWSEDIELISKEDFKKREKEANDFAAAFLLPEESFGKDAMSGPQTLPYYKKLKAKWKVSIAAMIRRAYQLEIMTYDQYQGLIITMQKRGLRKTEPLDDSLITSGPSLLKTAVLMLLQEGVFSKDSFMDELSTNYELSVYPEMVEYLLDLPEGTLRRSNIIEMPSLKVRPKAEENNEF